MSDREGNNQTSFDLPDEPRADTVGVEPPEALHIDHGPDVSAGQDVAQRPAARRDRLQTSTTGRPPSERESKRRGEGRGRGTRASGEDEGRGPHVCRIMSRGDVVETRVRRHASGPNGEVLANSPTEVSCT